MSLLGLSEGANNINKVQFNFFLLVSSVFPSILLAIMLSLGALFKQETLAGPNSQLMTPVVYVNEHTCSVRYVEKAKWVFSLPALHRDPSAKHECLFFRRLLSCLPPLAEMVISYS